MAECRAGEDPEPDLDLVEPATVLGREDEADAWVLAKLLVEAFGKVPLDPAPNDLLIDRQARADLVHIETISREQHDPGPLDLPALGLRRRTTVSSRFRGFLLSLTRRCVSLLAIRPSPAVSSSANSILQVNGRVRPLFPSATQIHRLRKQIVTSGTPHAVLPSQATALTPGPLQPFVTSHDASRRRYRSRLHGDGGLATNYTR